MYIILVYITVRVSLQVNCGLTRESAISNRKNNVDAIWCIFSVSKLWEFCSADSLPGSVSGLSQNKPQKPLHQCWYAVKNCIGFYLLLFPRYKLTSVLLEKRPSVCLGNDLYLCVRCWPWARIPSDTTTEKVQRCKQAMRLIGFEIQWKIEFAPTGSTMQSF